MSVITATFETRRDAELTIEHLVQEHEFDRENIVLGTSGDENTAGEEPDGSDNAAQLEDDGEEGAALNGAVMLSITVDDEDDAEIIQQVLEEYGAEEITSDI